MKKILILLLLSGLVLGNLACEKEIVIKNPFLNNETDDEEVRSDDDEVQPDDDEVVVEEIKTVKISPERAYHNFIGSGAFFAMIDKRMFYFVCPPNNEKNSCKLVELTADGTKAILEKQAYVRLYQNGEDLGIIAGTFNKNGATKFQEYKYDLTTDTLEKAKTLSKEGDYLKMDGSDRYYLKFARGKGDTLYLNDKKLISGMYQPNCSYIDEDYVYYAETAVKKYGIYRYDFGSGDKELILPVDSKILVKDEGPEGGYNVRAVSIEKMMIEGDYLVYVKGTNKLRKDGDYDQYVALAYRKLSDPAGAEELLTDVIAMDSKGKYLQLYDFTTADGRIFYYYKDNFFRYDLESDTSKKLLTLSSSQTPFKSIFGIYIADDGMIYLNTSNGVYKMDQEGDDLEVVYQKKY